MHVSKLTLFTLGVQISTNLAVRIATAKSPSGPGGDHITHAEAVDIITGVIQDSATTTGFGNVVLYDPDEPVDWQDSIGGKIALALMQAGEELSGHGEPILLNDVISQLRASLQEAFPVSTD